jgi:hypothetical protein
MLVKVALLLIHGIEIKTDKYAKKLENRIKQYFKKNLEKKIDLAQEEVVIERVFWKPVVDSLKSKLWEKIKDKNGLYKNAFKYALNFLSDGIIYQPVLWNNKNNSENSIIFAYDEINLLVSKALDNLFRKAGKEAPLCIVSHSLGSVIAYNYIKKIQEELNLELNSGFSSLVDNLVLFYTLGSPLAFYYLREWGDYSIKIPSDKILKYYPSLKGFGGWFNFYSKHDLFAYPLNGLFPNTEVVDISIDVGNIIVRNTPLCHPYYWHDDKIINHIASSLLKIYLLVNQIS